MKLINPLITAITVLGATYLVIQTWGEASYIAIPTLAILLAILAIVIAKVSKLDRWGSAFLTPLLHDYYILIPLVTLSFVLTYFSIWEPGGASTQVHNAILVATIFSIMITSHAFEGYRALLRHKRMPAGFVDVSGEWQGLVQNERGVGWREIWQWPFWSDSRDVWDNTAVPNAKFRITVISGSPAFSKEIVGFNLRRVSGATHQNLEVEYWTTNRRWRAVWPLGVAIESAPGTATRVNLSGDNFWSCAIEGMAPSKTIYLYASAGPHDRSNEWFRSGCAYRVTVLFDDGTYVDKVISIP